jgi:hypothetical protein
VEGVFSRLMLFSSREEFAIFRPRILSNFHMFSIPVTTPVLEDLAQSREVVKVYPDRMMYPLLPVADTGEVYADQRGKPFVTTKTVTKLLGAPDAWSKGYRGRGVNIAVIDTVALQQHQAIAKNILGGFPTSTIPGDYTDLNGHGVWVAAMAAGNQWVSPNGLETVGVAPEASLSLIKALGFVIGVGSDSSVIDAIGNAIARGAHIINMSLGSEQVPENLEDDPQAIAVKRATDAGILVLCAAGNSGPGPRTINSPGAVEEAITVGSYNPVTGRISDFSSVGPTPDGRIKPDVVAPGENVFGPAVGLLDFSLPPRGVLRASVLSGTCLTKDVNIYTPDGPVALGDLEIGDTVYSYSYDGRVVTGRITNIIEHDVKEIYEVSTCRSRRLIATGNHPVLIKDSGHTPPRWKKVEDLKPNKHSVVIATPDPTPVQELNEVITIDVARALGYFLADGWINHSKRNNQICVAPDGDWLFKTLGLPFKTYKGGKWHYTYSKKVALALTLLGFGQLHNNARLPGWVYHLEKDKIKAFIDGFAKGDACIQHGFFVFELASQWLVRDLKYLCDWVGYRTGCIKFRERTIKPPGTKAPRPWKSWVLCINTKRETAKTELVKNIEKIGEDKVYDLTIEPYPHFIAEGIVVHNSMATPAAAGIAALMYESAWRQGVRLTPAMFKDMMARYGEFAGNKSNYYGWGVPTWDIWERYAREVIGISV